MTFVSLFAGIGGFDRGLEAAGHECIGQCELDPHARAVLETHWPDTPKHDDVTTLVGDHFGPAEIVTFGSPCQDLSIAGKRAGLTGSRSSLFMEAVRFIREMLEVTGGRYPRFAVWENVPGAFSSNGGRDFAAVLASLVGGEVRYPVDGWAGAGVAFGPLGSAEWRVLDSQHFGVAQRRRRVFLVYRPGGERAGEVLLEPDGVCGHPPQGRAAGEGVAGTLEARTRGGGFPGTDGAIAGHVVPVAFKVRGGKEGGGKGYLGSEGQALTLDTMQGQYLAAPTAFVASDYSTGQYRPAEVADAITTSADRTRAAPIAFAENSRAELRLEGGDGQRTGSLNGGGGKPGQGIPTIATGYAVRRLTPRECERLQGFPDDHTRYRPDHTEIADTHRYRMLGNAVTVNVAAWLGHRLKEAA